MANNNFQFGIENGQIYVEYIDENGAVGAKAYLANESDNPDSELPTAQNISQKIAKAYVKVQGSSGAGNRIYGPVPFSASMNEIRFSPSQEDNVLYERSLKDVLFARFTKDTNGVVIQDKTTNDGYYPFDADSTSFYQILNDTKNEWDEDFFGIYVPNIQKVDVNNLPSIDLILNQPNFSISRSAMTLTISVANPELIASEINNIPNLIFTVQCYEGSSAKREQGTVQNAEVKNNKVEITFTTSANSVEWEDQAVRVILPNVVREFGIYEVDDNGDAASLPVCILTSDFSASNPAESHRWLVREINGNYTIDYGKYVGSFLNPEDITKYLLIPFIDENGACKGWRHVGKNENLYIKYNMDNDANKVSLWQALVESETYYNAAERESYIGDTYCIASQGEVTNLFKKDGQWEWGENFPPDQSSNYVLQTTSAQKNKFVTLQGLQDYDVIFRKRYLPLMPAANGGKESWESPYSANEIGTHISDRQTLVSGSFAIGARNKLRHNLSGAIGQGLYSTRDNSLIIGAYNDTSDTSSFFAIGTGISDANRKTAFRVFHNDGEPEDKVEVRGGFIVRNAQDNNNWIVSVNAYSPDPGKTLRGYTELNGGQYVNEGEEYGNILRFANTCGFGLSENTDQYFKIWNINDTKKGGRHVSLVPSQPNTMDLGQPNYSFRYIYGTLRNEKIWEDSTGNFPLRMIEQSRDNYLLKCGYKMLHLGNDDAPLKRVKTAELDSTKVIIYNPSTDIGGLYLKAGDGKDSSNAWKILKFDNLCGFGAASDFKNTAGNFTGNRFFQLQIQNENDAGYLALQPSLNDKDYAGLYNGDGYLGYNGHFFKAIFVQQIISPKNYLKIKFPNGATLYINSDGTSTIT